MVYSNSPNYKKVWMLLRALGYLIESRDYDSEVINAENIIQQAIKALLTDDPKCLWYLIRYSARYAFPGLDQA